MRQASGVKRTSQPVKGLLGDRAGSRVDGRFHPLHLVLVVESRLEQLSDGLESFSCVSAIGTDRQLGALSGAECQQRKNTLAIHLLTVLTDQNVRLELAGQSDQHVSGARVQSLGIAHGNCSGQRGFIH